jgi:heme exporter protein CcmD
MSEWFAMGGYGSYVGAAYSVTFVLLAAEIALLLLRARRERSS